MKKIAIIGAGLSGITLAKKLSQKADVHVFEKGRGIGGRMSTRYADPFVFDHGAPCWTIKTKEFQNFLNPLMGVVVAKWNGDVIELGKNSPSENTISQASYFVGIPHMNSLCKHLAIGLNIKIECEVMIIKAATEKKWRLLSSRDEDLGFYDLVISTAPAPQTAKLFGEFIPKKNAIFNATFDSCFALMVGINQPWDKNWIAAKIYDSPIKWIGVNSTKPRQNQNLSCLVIHSDPKWTKANLHRDIKEIQDILLKELNTLINLDIKKPSYISTHRWLYYNVQPFNHNPYYADLETGLCAVGDWCQMSDIETVWLNAEKAASFLASKI